MRKLVVALVMLAGITITIGPADRAAARPILPEGGMATKRSIDADVAGFDRQHGPHSQIECTVAAGGASNVRLDCDDPFPNNEPDIEVDPDDPLHMIASSNDYGTCCDQFYTTFDGGQTWITGNMSREKPLKIGSDPVTVFDRKHRVAIHASLSFSVQHASGTQACDGDVVVSISRDGGKTWEIPVLVDDGQGCDFSATQLFNDKEWIVTDNNPTSPFYGRTYLTWSKFESHNGMYASSAIFEAQSDDGGDHWSTPQKISGSNPALCTAQVSGPAGECDENQFSVTNIDVFLMRSSDGASWTGPTRVDASGSDQWFPWVEVNPATGAIGVLYNDRSTADPTLYNAALAQGTAGALSKTIVSTAASHPTESRFFRAGIAGCENCATFHGDYIAIAYGSDGKANLTWTDMRDVDPQIPTRFDQFIYFAQR